MKFVRLRRQGTEQWGILEEDRIYGLEGELYGDCKKGRELSRLDQVDLLPPADPKVMVGCILNYRDRIKEQGRVAFRELSLYFKPPNTLLAPFAPIKFPMESRDNHFEAELCVVMKHAARNVPEKEALKYVLGYTCGNDLTAFGYYKKDENLTRAKAFDGAGPLGPVLATDIDPARLSIKARRNGELKQDSNTENMVFNVSQLISHISAFMTLSPGDVIWTGSPKGGGCPAKAGDTLEVEIEGIGTLKNRIET